MTPGQFTEIREHIGRPKASVAKSLGYTVRMVQKWEAGDGAIPSLVAGVMRIAYYNPGILDQLEEKQ